MQSDAIAPTRICAHAMHALYTKPCTAYDTIPGSIGLCRRARQQEEWEARQEERKARQAEMAGEPFDKEVGSPLTLHPHLTRLNCKLCVIQLPHVQARLWSACSQPGFLSDYDIHGHKCHMLCSSPRTQSQAMLPAASSHNRDSGCMLLHLLYYHALYCHVICSARPNWHW